MSMSAQVKAELIKAIAAVGDLATTGKIRRATQGYDTVLGEVTTTYKTATFKGAWTDNGSALKTDKDAATVNSNVTSDRNITIINDNVIFSPNVEDELVIGSETYNVVSVRAEPGEVAWFLRVQRK